MNDPMDGPNEYFLTISRKTIQHLGVKLYDKVSAVVAELIANSYDADADKVTVRLPLKTLLATGDGKKQPVDHGYLLEVVDDGHGMAPDEAKEFYLKVGRERRNFKEQGERSRKKGRPVMGRKGIGKLAPFGVCKRIEVLSAGGKKTANGFLVSHFYIDYDKILSDDDEPVRLDLGDRDRSYSKYSGTTIRLSDFLPKRIPSSEVFHRQLAARFAFVADTAFEITVVDTREPHDNPPKKVKPVDIPLAEGTKIILSERPVQLDDGEQLSVGGWLGMGKTSYKYEEFTGVRIYVRGKIVATTRDFEQPAGYTGEYTVRSYLVGEVHADWLDDDDGEDLIRSDRQGIIWDSEYGRALTKWGRELIKEIGVKSSGPRRDLVSDIFMKNADFKNRANTRYPNHKEVADIAIELAKDFSRYASEEELEKEDYLTEFSELILSVAPHKALIESFRIFAEQVRDGSGTINNLLDLFSKTRVAELASYAQIADERIKSILELEKIVNSGNVGEDKFQELLARAPWLIEPTWTVISSNQSLRTFKDAFEVYYKRKTGNEVTLAIEHSRKMPDFILVSLGKMLHIVEIKPVGHTFNNNDFERLINYLDAFDNFFEDNPEIRSEFPKGWQIEIICDDENITDLSKRKSYQAYIREEKLDRTTWHDFLMRAKNANEEFLKVNEIII